MLPRFRRIAIPIGLTAALALATVISALTITTTSVVASSGLPCMPFGGKISSSTSSLTFAEVRPSCGGGGLPYPPPPPPGYWY